MNTTNSQHKQQQLTNYALVTKSRHLIINWKKVELLHKKTTQHDKNQLQEPFNQVKYAKQGKILGKY